jgi:hypothetical protein
MATRKRSKRLWTGLVLVIVVAALVAGVYRMGRVQAAVNPPTAKARKGEFALEQQRRFRVSSIYPPPGD